MDWLKKKKDEAKQAASQAAAKMQNKRTAYKGEGNVLGGGDAGAASAPSAAAAAPPSRGFKVPAFGKSKAEPPPLTEDEKRQRREAQVKALEDRTGAWEKRVANARKARLQQETELEDKFETLPPPPPSSPSEPPAATNGPAPRVLSAEEMKAFEVQSAQAQIGFNPYNAVFSSSSEANTAMHSISSSTSQPIQPPPAPSRVPPPPPTQSAEHGPRQVTGISPEPATEGAGGVYVLLRQDPAQAIAATQIIIKMLGNVLKSPEEEKFRKIRVANPSIQSKLVAVSGAVDLLQEAGFAPLEIDGEQFLVLSAFDAARVQAVLDRTEVASIQLQVDSADLSA